MAGAQNRKIQRAIPLFLVILCFSVSPAEAQYGGGSGTAGDPYLIFTAEQMNAVGANPNDWDKHFRLMADIDLSNYTGADFNIIGYVVEWDQKPFTGVFDGNGKTISNFSYASTDAGSIGLFGYVSGENGENAEIKNLGLIDPNVDVGLIDPDADAETDWGVGSLVGSVIIGTINNCYVQGGSVSGDENVGGLVGSNLGWFGWYEGGASVGGGVSVGTIVNCYSTCSVSGNENVGGLVGNNLVWYGSYELGVGSAGTIINCHSTGSISGDENVGGLVGQNGTAAGIGDPGGAVTNCYSTGSVSGTTDVGGLVGNNWDTITDCYAAGSVSGNDYVGGLAGTNAGTITNCYSAGGVTGSIPVGGLVGDNAEGTITNSFWNAQTSAQYNMCGDTGPEGSGCDNTNGKTTAEMKMASTFLDAGWDFVGQPDGPHDIWVEPVGGGYPILWWQLSPL
ncbi:MAG: GLUG motif-containing protein, partial [Planctomycetota bacterium]